MEGELKYFGYVRKSTDRDDRQALSIDSQKEKIREMSDDVKVVKIFEERKSAYKPEERSVFAEMIARIERGEAQGIIAWHPNRLSRNEIDAARITYMIRERKIKDLKFGSYGFDNSPEGIWMLQMAMSQSQYESAKLSKDVRRGCEKKASLGHLPARAPIGYLNSKGMSDKGEKYIYPDPDRFDLVRRMWDLMLTGQYSVSRIAEIANKEWGFSTYRSKHTGGNPINGRVLYGMFGKLFYTGRFEYDGKVYQGSYKAMVTREEYDRVQELLGRKDKPRVTKRQFPFTGLLKCGECGCQITAEVKHKTIQSTGEQRAYVYYHCTRKRRDVKCSQRKHITEPALQMQFEREIDKYTILPEFRDLALKILRRDHETEIQSRSQIYESQHKALTTAQGWLDKLMDMRLNDQIDDAEYQRKRTQLKSDVSRLEELLRDTEGRADEWLELTEQAFDFATYAHIRFLQAKGGDEKRELLTKLGQNLTLKDGKVLIEAKPWLRPIGEKYPAVLAQFLQARTKESGSVKTKTAAMAAANDSWRAIWGSNPGHAA